MSQIHLFPGETLEITRRFLDAADSQQKAAAVALFSLHDSPPMNIDKTDRSTALSELYHFEEKLIEIHAAFVMGATNLEFSATFKPTFTLESVHAELVVYLLKTDLFTRQETQVCTHVRMEVLDFIKAIPTNPRRPLVPTLHVHLELEHKDNDCL